jgi:glutathione S-transferase
MLTVHHLGMSQSERIVWLCEELGIPYELKRYDREATGLAPAAYKALHPCGTAPVITDGAVTLGETGAIVEYILTKYGNGKLAVPPSSPDYAHYVFWLHFANGSIQPMALVNLLFTMSGVTDGSGIADMFRGRLHQAHEMMNKRLGEAPYLGGSALTAADIVSVFGLTTMRAIAKTDLASYPNIQAYLKRIGERPGYQRAMKQAEPNGLPQTGWA